MNETELESFFTWQTALTQLKTSTQAVSFFFFTDQQQALWHEFEEKILIPKLEQNKDSLLVHLQALKGDVEAQFKLAEQFRHERNIDLAKDLYLKGANQGHALSQFWLGRILKDENKTQEALKWFLKAADQGIAWGYFEAGIFFVKDQPDAAFVYFEHGHRLNNIDCLYGMGYMYYLKGEYVKSFPIMRTLAEEKDKTDAQHALGQFYLHGLGIAKDEAKAIEWLQKAANRGHMQAKADLQALREQSSKPH